MLAIFSVGKYGTTARVFLLILTRGSLKFSPIAHRSFLDALSKMSLPWTQEKARRCQAEHQSLFYSGHGGEQDLTSHKKEPYGVRMGVQLAVGRYSPNLPSRLCIRTKFVLPSGQPLNWGERSDKDFARGGRVRPKGGACFPNRRSTLNEALSGKAKPTTTYPALAALLKA